METTGQIRGRQAGGPDLGTVPKALPANDNRQPPGMRRSIFPEGAVARIYRPCRAATISGTARTKTWRLVFERRSPPFIEPLMGHTGGDDTLI